MDGEYIELCIRKADVMSAAREKAIIELGAIREELYVLRQLASGLTPRALDAADVCRVINHFYVEGVCSQCGSIEPPRQ